MPDRRFYSVQYPGVDFRIVVCFWFSDNVVIFRLNTTHYHGVNISIFKNQEEARKTDTWQTILQDMREARKKEKKQFKRVIVWRSFFALTGFFPRHQGLCQHRGGGHPNDGQVCQVWRKKWDDADNLGSDGAKRWKEIYNLEQPVSRPFQWSLSICIGPTHTHTHNLNHFPPDLWLYICK